MSNFWRGKKVVVTGAAGFIGSHMVYALEQKEAEVTACVSYRATQKDMQTITKKNPKTTLVKVDLLDLKACREVTKGAEIVLNFAAIDGSAQFKKDHCAEIFRTNTQIVFNMLEASRLEGIDRFLLVSSTEVYEHTLTGRIKEDSALLDDVTNPTVGYGLSKRATELAGKLYYEQYKLKVAIARPGNVYGPGDYIDDEKSRVIPTFIKKAYRGETIHLVGNGLQTRSFLYIDDLLKGLLLLTEKHPYADPVNLTGSKPITIKKLAKVIAQIIGNKTKIISKKNTEIDTKRTRRVISSQKAKRMLGFDEDVSLEDGLEKTIIEMRRYL